MPRLIWSFPTNRMHPVHQKLAFLTMTAISQQLTEVVDWFSMNFACLGNQYLLKVMPIFIWYNWGNLVWSRLITPQNSVHQHQTMVVVEMVTYCKIFFICISFFIFKKCIHEHHQGVKQLGSRSALTFCQGWSGSKLFVKVISRRFDYVIEERVKHKWASTRENLSSGVCEQHSCRPACPSVQSDQWLCYSLFRKYHM